MERQASLQVRAVLTKDVGPLQHVSVTLFPCACCDDSAKTLSVSCRANVATDSRPVAGAVRAMGSERAVNRAQCSLRCHIGIPPNSSPSDQARLVKV